MTDGVETWGGPSVRATPAEDDCGGTCSACQVKAAGAREAAKLIGVDYDTAAAETQAHLRHFASHIYSAMSEAILEIPGLEHLGVGSIGPDGALTPTDPTS